MNRIILLYIIVLQSFFLLGCTSFDANTSLNANLKETKRIYKEKPPASFFGELPIKAIKWNGNGYISVSDWYDNSSVLYTIDSVEGSKIYKHHLYSGISELFYEAPNLITTVKASQNGNFFAVQTAISSYEANLVILDKNGQLLMKSALNSIEMQFVWNPFEEDELFITSFQEDWSFQNYIMHVRQKMMESSDVSQPFVQWIDTSKVAYLKWENNEHMNAPLFSYNIKNSKELKIQDHVLAYHTFKDILVTVSGSENASLYQLFDPETMQLLQSFQLPLIDTYSDRWWIPNFTYDPETSSFIYFRPILKDNEVESIQLVSFSTLNGEEIRLLDDTSDRPIMLSPDGKLCLIGYQFEEMIDLKKKKVFSLLDLT